MSDETHDHPAFGAPATADPPAPAPLSPIEPTRFQFRFMAVYAVLGLVLVGAGVVLVVLAARPGAKPAQPWSTWEPTPGTVAKMSNQIADHVSHSYRLDKGGTQLVAVVPSKPTVTSGTTNIAIKAIGIRSKGGIEVLNTNKTEMFTFCGLGTHCSITGGQATALRGRLVRREALEVAMYTFKFVPSVDSVVAFMPPPPGSTTSPLIFLRKADFKEVLGQPLRTTLPRATPPLPTESDPTEASTIDQLTLSSTFNYQLQALQTGGAALVLDPQT